MLSPTVCNVGMLGNLGHSAKSKGKIYWIWLGIIRRCYDTSAPFYKWYGGRGVTVCDRWKRFDYFFEDIFKIPGFDKDLIEKGELELDKDLLHPELKIYSPETCSFVTHAENCKPVVERINKERSAKKNVTTIRKE